MFLNSSIHQQLSTSLVLPRGGTSSPPTSTTSKLSEPSRGKGSTEQPGESNSDETGTYELLASSFPQAAAHKRMSKKDAEERHDADQYHWLKYGSIVLAFRRKGEPPPPEKGIRKTTEVEVTVEAQEDVEKREKALKDMEQTKKVAERELGTWPW